MFGVTTYIWFTDSKSGVRFCLSRHVFDLPMCMYLTMLLIVLCFLLHDLKPYLTTGKRKAGIKT